MACFEGKCPDFQDRIPAESGPGHSGGPVRPGTRSTGRGGPAAAGAGIGVPSGVRRSRRVVRATALTRRGPCRHPLYANPPRRGRGQTSERLTRVLQRPMATFTGSSTSQPHTTRDPMRKLSGAVAAKTTTVAPRSAR